MKFIPALNTAFLYFYIFSLGNDRLVLKYVAIIKANTLFITKNSCAGCVILGMLR
jgi:hypothetical protein